VERVFAVPVLGCPILFGVSANDRRWADNRSADFLGWKPQDNAEAHLARLDAEQGDPDPAAPDFHHIGGPYVDMPVMTDADNEA
ncbi:MAG: NAD-dependent dehydratase, partial [SAR116 cluster bacterium]|nr:NAD-dependent dehydratase [SAR116 cluster bacterium]